MIIIFISQVGQDKQTLSTINHNFGFKEWNEYIYCLTISKAFPCWNTLGQVMKDAHGQRKHSTSHCVLRKLLCFGVLATTNIKNISHKAEPCA